MSAIQVIQSVMPLIQNAAAVVASFTGTDDDEARGDSVVQQALEVIGTIAPLVDSFSRGSQVTPEDVRAALAGMDEALSDFDAEIARQGG